MKCCKAGIYQICAIMLLNCACNGQSNPSAGQKKATQPTAAGKKFEPGKDFVAFNRVKIMDKEAFTAPAEAYSILLPEGWTSEGGVFWTPAGSPCAGTNVRFSAKSNDGKYAFEILPNFLWSWSNNPQAVAMSRQYNTSRYCDVGEPLDASQYLKSVWMPGLQNARITDEKPNLDVINAMAENDDRGRAELMRYGASRVNFRHTAVTARLQLNNGTGGIGLCSVSNIESYIPNVYDGSYSISYISTATRMLFTFPQGEAAAAEKMMTVIVAGFRTNPAWKQATDAYWRDVREKKHIAHLGTIKMIDERTRQIAKTAIQNGNNRLAEMDSQMRSWEAQQSSQDRMHTNFVKAIREVENYRDENGKVELSAGYDHAWSRGDGTSFILSNNPNFDPSSAFQDQRWREMKKVD